MLTEVELNWVRSALIAHYYLNQSIFFLKELSFDKIEESPGENEKHGD